MSAIDAMKDYAAVIRNSELLAPLRRQQALEIAVSLFSSAPSWKQFVAQPSTPVIPQTLEDYLAAVTRTQRRIAALKVASILPRSERALFAMGYLAEFAAPGAHDLSRLWQLLDAADVEKFNVMDHKGSRVASVMDPQSCELRLAIWFFSKYGNGDYPWTRSEHMAVKAGFTPTEASTIGLLQREAPNHAWDLRYWFEVGVLDPDQESFLKELKGEPDWFQRFQNLYETDGGRHLVSSTHMVTRPQGLH